MFGRQRRCIVVLLRKCIGKADRLRCGAACILSAAELAKLPGEHGVQRPLFVWITPV